MDPKTTSSIGKKNIDDSDGVLANTLRPMLGSVRKMPSSFGFLSYSDQPPGAEADANKFGHSKGVVMGDSSSQTALWITHSTPQFPFRRDQNQFYPESGKQNGQSFMCVSLPFSELKTVGEHLQRIHAYPYDYDLPDSFPEELKNTAKWKTIESDLGELKDLKIRGKDKLRIMAKPLGITAEDGDLYEKLATKLKSELKAQTWRSGNFCDIRSSKVINVVQINTGLLNSWLTSIDHSKWAVTTRTKITETCFGDVNRCLSQFKRWGGALCINNEQVNTEFQRYTLPRKKRPRDDKSDK